MEDEIQQIAGKLLSFIRSFLKFFFLNARPFTPPPLSFLIGTAIKKNFFFGFPLIIWGGGNYLKEEEKNSMEITTISFYKMFCKSCENNQQTEKCLKDLKYASLSIFCFN